MWCEFKVVGLPVKPNWTARSSSPWLPSQSRRGCDGVTKLYFHYPWKTIYSLVSISVSKSVMFEVTDRKCSLYFEPCSWINSKKQTYLTAMTPKLGLWRRTSIKKNQVSQQNRVYISREMNRILLHNICHFFSKDCIKYLFHHLYHIKHKSYWHVILNRFYKRHFCSLKLHPLQTSS